MENLVLSTNSWDEETFIYLTREYKNNFCLNEYEIGIGKADDPLRRWKEHNAASSKSTVKIAFEYIYLVKTKEYERQLHKRLVSMGFTNIEKEVFTGINNHGQTLTIEYLSNILEKEAIDGPWAIIDGKITTTNKYNEIKNKREKESAEKLFINSNTYNPGLINQLKIALEKNILDYDFLAPQYKNDLKIVNHLIEKNLLTLQQIPQQYLFELDIILSSYKKNIIDASYVKNNIDKITDSTNKYDKDLIPQYINEQIEKIEKRKQEKENQRIIEEQQIQKRSETKNRINEIKDDLRHGKIKTIRNDDFYIKHHEIINFALVNKYLTIFDIHVIPLREYFKYNSSKLLPIFNHLIHNEKYIYQGYLNRTKICKMINGFKLKKRLLFFNILMIMMSPLTFLYIIGKCNIILPYNLNEIVPWCLPAIFIFILIATLPDEKISLIEKIYNNQINLGFKTIKIYEDESEIQQALQGKFSIQPIEQNKTNYFEKRYKTNDEIRRQYNFKNDDF